MTIGGLGSGLDFLYDENATEVQVKKTLRVSDESMFVTMNVYM